MQSVVYFRHDLETVVTCNFSEIDFVLRKEMFWQPKIALNIVLMDSMGLCQ